MEIERKFLVKQLPFDLKEYRYDEINQGYISISPVIRIRQKGNQYYLTCKSKGFLEREEFEISIAFDEFDHLINKIEYNLIQKKRYYIPIENNLTIELDIFSGYLEGLMLCEVEYPTLEAANAFKPLSWFSEEVTTSPIYQNNNLCQLNKLP